MRNITGDCEAVGCHVSAAYAVERAGMVPIKGGHTEPIVLLCEKHKADEMSYFDGEGKCCNCGCVRGVDYD